MVSFQECKGRRSAASSNGAFVIVGAASARAGRRFDVRRALEVSSFAFMHSNQQRCEINWTIFVMVDLNFEVVNMRRPTTPRAAVIDSEVPPGAM